MSEIFHPLNRRVLVLPDEKEKKEEKTASGIVLPDTAKEPTKPTGTMMDWAPDCEMEHNSKMRVMYNLYGYDEIELEGKKYHLLPETDLIGYYAG